MLDYPGTGSWAGCGAPSDSTKDTCFYGFGWESDDVPVVGDWNGDGRAKIGVYRNGAWYLDYPGTGSWVGCGAPSDPTKDACFSFGWTGGTPVVGDWNGNGKSKIGVYGNGTWLLDYPGTGSWIGCGAPSDTSKDACFYGFGWLSIDVPVVGDWSGSGKTNIGIYRSGSWYLDYPGTGSWIGCGAPSDATKDACFYGFGWNSTDVPVVGDWSGNGKTKIGIYRSSGSWYLDYPGTGSWIGCGAPSDTTKNACFYGFGWSGAVPIVGSWKGKSSGGNSASLVSIAVTPANSSLAVGSSKQFAATGTYSDGSTQDITSSVTWASTLTSVATISNVSGANGLGSSVAPGTTTISATSGSIAGSTTLTVSRATLVSIAVTPANPTIAKGGTEQFTATGTYSDGSTQIITSSVTWSSSATSVATIAGTNGLASSVATGTTIISAISGSISGTTTLTVTPATLASITITPANPSIASGTIKQFSATGNYTDDSTKDLTASVTWSSSAATVATISNVPGSSGLATSTSAGTTIISATLGNVSGTTTLTVTQPTLVSIAVSPANPSIGVASTKQFTATGTYSDGSTQNLTTSVTWTSALTSVATVSNVSGSNGLATSVAAGTTTISATSGIISGTATLTVTAATLSFISVTPTSPSIVLGTTQQFTATGTNTDGSVQNLTASVSWSSSSASVATISNASGSNGKATSVAAGSTTITATLGSVSGSSTLTVTSPTATTPSSYTTPIVGVLPSSLAIDYTGNVWVTNFGINTATELLTGMTSSGGVVNAPISLNTWQFGGASPFGIAIDYTNDIWMTNYDSFNGGYAITMLEQSQPAWDNTGGCPVSAAGSCDCPSVYPLLGKTKDAGGDKFYTYTAGTGPRGMAIDGSGNVWVTNYGTNTITEYSPTYYFCPSSATKPGHVAVTSASYSVGNNPYGVAIDSLSHIWVSNYGSNTVTELSSSGTVLGTTTVGTRPMGIAVDPLGNVWVANSGDNTVTKLSYTGTVLGTFSVGSVPHNIAIETSGNVWVTNFGTTTSPGNTVSVLNTSGTLINTFTVGKNPEGIAIDFWGNVWVSNYYDNTLTVWKGATSGPHFSPYSGPIWPQ
ncbi:MAG: Ig-like domain-containing protein [Nitrospirae bacterium]|nr:Ig-like domain-containing protein [Nitrospirota bacterium]